MEILNIVIRQAGLADVQIVSEILTIAATLLEKQGIPLWNVHDLSEENLLEDAASGLYILAEVDGKPAGILKLTMRDPLCWPDVLDWESAYIQATSPVIQADRDMFVGNC